MPAYERWRPVTDFAGVVLCDNPGTMRLNGTNSWVLRAHGHPECVVVDPGPRRHRQHVKALVAQGRIVLVLISHRHPDHAGASGALRALSGAPVRAWRSVDCQGGEPLQEGEIITAAGLQITVIHTPGHTDDSVSFLVQKGSRRAVVTGDTILGEGTSVLDWRPDALRSYLQSLDKLAALGTGCVLLPGHGPEHTHLLSVVEFYQQHRRDRLAQLRRVLDELGISAVDARPLALLPKIYADTDMTLWPAAYVSLKAQLHYLRQTDI
ncbi:MBL fold metallo-hydrolase [Mycobacteroides abscessus]|nr:MBL fold metallo-hydrolase [Mycobacteroides abscessus]